MGQSIITLRLSKKIESSRLSKDNLKRLCAVLEERINSAADIEVNNLQRPANTSDEGFDEIKQNVRDAFQLAITAKGIDHQELYGTPGEVFSNPNFPEDLLSFYANSSTTLRGRFNYTPRNEVEVLVDFSPPAKFDFNTSPGVATKNDSAFNISGIDATWCNGLFHELEKFFEAKTNYLPLIHKGDFWNLLFWIFGIPICFWVAYRVSPIVSRIFGGISEFVLATVYLYILFIAAHLLRAVFWYARWIYPKVEYVGGKSNIRKHRTVLISILIGITVSLIYDLLKILA